MAYALVVIGLVMVITGVNNTYAALGAQLRADFTGKGNFVVWLMAIGSVGALGYVQTLRQFSHYFMALILIALVLSHKGFIAQFQAALNQGPQAPAATPDTGTASKALPGDVPLPQGGSIPPIPGTGDTSVQSLDAWKKFLFGR